MEAPDRDTVVALSSRLTAGVAPWRHRDHVGAGVRAWVVAAIDGHDPEQQPVYVAEDVDGSVVGFVSVSSRPHWSGGVDAYVGELAVAERAAREGVGSALMHAAEEWGRRQGYRRLSVETGAANTAARAFYQSRGYQDEDIRLSVPLADDQQ